MGKSMKICNHLHNIVYYDPKECLKRSGNIINRKNTNFYIETISPKKSQLKKNIFFDTTKIFSDFLKNKNFQKKKRKIENFEILKISIFSSKIKILKILKISIFRFFSRNFCFSKKYENIFFVSKKYIF